MSGIAVEPILDLYRLDDGLTADEQGQDLIATPMGSVAKMNHSEMAHEVAQDARAVGDNGILGDSHIMRHLVDLEATYTHEGTYDVNLLVAGR